MPAWFLTACGISIGASAAQERVPRREVVATVNYLQRFANIRDRETRGDRVRYAVRGRRFDPVWLHQILISFNNVSGFVGALVRVTTEMACQVPICLLSSETIGSTPDEPAAPAAAFATPPHREARRRTPLLDRRGAGLSAHGLMMNGTGPAERLLSGFAALSSASFEPVSLDSRLHLWCFDMRCAPVAPPQAAFPGKLAVLRPLQATLILVLA